MKTKLFNPALTLAVFMLASCSAGLQVSNTSSWDDEIYGTTNSKSTKVQVANASPVAHSAKSEQYNKLDGKFAEALKALEDSSKNDTVIYKAEDPNPYRRILSDSYQESYERRLRGFEDPRYGIEDWSVYYSDDWRYAQAYDPSYYRVVVMGSNVWVEPWYIYNSFGWPRSRFYFGFGFGWGYNPWNSYYLGYYWDPWYYNPWYYNPWYYSPYVASNAYWSGWYDATYYWDKYTPNSNRYYYGRRGNTTNNTDQYVGGRSTSVIPADGQIVTSRRSRTDVPAETNPVVTTRETQTRVTPTYETRRSEGRTTSTGNQTVVRRGGTSTRVSDGTGDFSSSRTSRPTREIGISEPTRRGTTPTYERPRTGNSGEYNSTRRVENPSTRSTITRNPSTTKPTRTTTPTYNRPNRVSTPSSSQPSTRSHDYERPRSSSSGSSSSNSSVSRSSSSSSSRSSSSSSSGTSTTRRR
ncbi:MAG: hypothetical protein H5T24_07435 [Bacteroidales bacterium]|nr:hypothetical protein [Bacteroidales bacterium]